MVKWRVMTEWSFLTNHARALVCIAHDPGVRLRDIATTVGITERSAYAIVTDLAAAGYVVKDKDTDGRRNRYQIQSHLPLPETIGRERTIGEVLDVLVDSAPRTSPTSRSVKPRGRRLFSWSISSRKIRVLTDVVICFEGGRLHIGPKNLGASNPRRTGRIEGSVRTQTAVSEIPPMTGAQVPSSPDRPEDKNVPAGRPAPPAVPKEPRSTRVSRAWNRVVPALVVLAFILVFIFQNLHRTRVSFLVLSGTLPLAVALLAAAAFGGLFVLALGSIRMVQLKKVIRRSRTNDAHAAPDGAK